MISVRGSRRIPYSEFHTGYKRNVLAADELLYAIHLPRRFARHKQYLRKVGTRRAMAIAKVALGSDRARRTRRQFARFALAQQVWRLFPRGFCNRGGAAWANHHARNSQSLRGAHCSPKCKPIDDIRSTAEYRRRVAANLLEEFLARTAPEGSQA